MERTIKVTGKGNIKVKPDLTVINLDFSGVEKEYALTLEKAANDINEVRNTLIKLGFKNEDIRTKRFDIDVAYESYKDDKGNYKSKFIGYKYCQTLAFSFDANNQTLGKVLYALAHMFVKPRVEITFTIKDVENAKNLLLKDAVNDAKSKAIILADASGIKLGNVLNIDYSFVNIDFRMRMLEDYCCDKATTCIEDQSYDNL